VNATVFIADVVRRLPPASELVLATRHAETVTLEAALAGPARQCGLADEVVLALRQGNGVARLRMTGKVGADFDASAAAAMLRALPHPGKAAPWPALRAGCWRDWAGDWRACVASWECHVERMSSRLRPGEILAVSLERCATEVHDALGRRSEVLSHRAHIRVVVRGGGGGGGWEMTVPVSVGACRGGVAALDAARSHARLRAAVRCRTAARTRGGPTGVGRDGATCLGRVVLGPAAVAEALARWRTSSDARLARHHGLAAVVAGEEGPRTLDWLTDTVTRPPWHVRAGRARRPSRGASLFVNHVETWLSGDDRDGATAIVAGVRRPGGPAASIEVRVLWQRLDEAVRLTARRGPTRRKVQVGGRAIVAPWLDLGDGRWLCG